MRPTLSVWFAFFEQVQTNLSRTYESNSSANPKWSRTAVWICIDSYRFDDLSLLEGFLEVWKWYKKSDSHFFKKIMEKPSGLVLRS